ncbi:MAG: NlpC/P60 family protein [Pseudomonadota bacterium]
MTVDRCAEADRIVAAARSWIGTPYQHQASCRGAGSDCLGLIRGLWRELYGAEPEAVPAYTPDWSEADGVERLLAGAERHLERVPTEARRPGDLLLFRMRAGAVAKHVGIMAAGPGGYPTLIHAYSGHAVCETPLGSAWIWRLAAVFRFPEEVR